MTVCSIVWLRQDLRLTDQPAFAAAAAKGAVIPVYVLDDEAPGLRNRIGGAQRWWLHGSLERLATDLEGLGSRLVLRRGRSVEVLKQLLEETGAQRVQALHHAEPWWRMVERGLGDRLELREGNNLASLRQVVTGEGRPFRIYAAFWRALQAHMPPPAPLARPSRLPAPDRWPRSDKLEDWSLRPTKPDWAAQFDMVPGEAEAARRLAVFADRVDTYEVDRNFPAEDGTSRLSPHLHFGEISPSTVWHAVEGRSASEKFRKELAWRDFTQGLTLALPDYASTNGNPKFDALAWRTGDEARLDLQAWQRGRTGYPIVDAGMRQLWNTGWMHNRVRMVAASFLVKHLLIDWRVGWEWFWDCLVDADYGNNSVNWQWVAGTGVDANMFNRIMAPLVQSEKFNAGGYIRRWVPELRAVPDAEIHNPGSLGTYPTKIIGHREGRDRALGAAQSLKVVT